jgi:hypothetical protein
MLAKPKSLEPLFGAYWDDALGWALRALKNDAWIVWFLRWERLMIWSRIVRSPEHYKRPEHEGVADLFRRDAEDYARRSDCSVAAVEDAAESFVTSQYRRDLEHLLSLPCDEIQRFRPGFMLPEEVRVRLKAMEQKWREQVNRVLSPQRVAEQGMRPFIEFPDGWAWFINDKESCEIEAAAMGHCGNTTSPVPSDRIVSLRGQIEMEAEDAA